MVGSPSILGLRTRPSGADRDRPSLLRAVVIGGSAGGLEAFSTLIEQLPADFGMPILTVQHLHPADDGRFAECLRTKTALVVIEPCDKQPIVPGHMYVAPANYHMLVERDHTIALSVDEKINWSRPSIDVLFQTAVDAYGQGLVAVILSGANADGAAGIRTVKANGGIAIVQDPRTASYPVMPQAAIDAAPVDFVLPPIEIAELLVSLARAEVMPVDGAWDAGLGGIP